MAAQKFFTTEHDAETLIIAIHEGVGSLADVEVVTQFDDLIDDVSKLAIRSVIVDFGEVSYFGSTMLEALLRLWNKLQAIAGKLALCCVSDVGTEILHVAKFDTLWPIYSSRAEALEAVQT